MKARLIINEIKRGVESSGLGPLGLGRSNIISKIVNRAEDVLNKNVEPYEIDSVNFPEEKIKIKIKYNSILHNSYDNYMQTIISYANIFDNKDIDVDIVPDIKNPRSNLIRFSIEIDVNTEVKRKIANYYVQSFLNSAEELKFTPPAEFASYVSRLEDAGYICLSSSLQYRRGIIFLYDVDNFENYVITVAETDGYVSFSKRTSKRNVPMSPRDVKEKTLDGYVNYLINEKLTE